jgi:hypothetical protein
MAPTSIFFNGRLISIPGAYSQVDVSGLEQQGLGASGIVACIGTAIGGKPYNVVPESDVKSNLQTATRPPQPATYFRAGDLLEAAPILFAPSVDPDVPAGAQEIVFVKANPAAPSSASFDNADGEALVLTSRDYGHFTTQINVTIGTGTTKGKKITVTFEAIAEAIDDAGGDQMFSLVYLSGTPADGFTTVTAKVTASAIIAAFTRDQAGLAADVSAQVTTGQVIELVSDDAGDTDVIIEIYGTDGSDATQREQVTLTGTSAIDTTSTWNSFHGARVISGTPAGTVTLRNDGGGTTITTLTAGAPTKGLEPLVDCAVAGSALSYVGDGATTARVTVYGLNAAGVVQTEVVLLAGTTPVAGTATWSRIDYLALGELAGGVVLTVSGNAVSVSIGPEKARTTLQQVADRFNGTLGFTCVLITGRTSFLVKDLDVVAATSCKSPTTPVFYANAYLIVEAVNAKSALVAATRGTPGTGAPTNTSDAVYLAGGHEGSATPGQEGTPTASTSDYQACLDLLTKVRVNSIVVLTHTPAIHAALAAHIQYMNGPGKSERDGAVGVQNSGDTGYATKTEIKAQIIDLNTRNIRVWAQGIGRYNADGDREIMTPKFGAAMLLGAQAGSPVGTSLTRKFMNILDLEQDASWNPVDDAEEMIQAGLVFAETIDGIGRRVVRNITTHLSSSNIAYTEASANEAINYSVYTYRQAMEAFVGKSGFSGTVVAAEGEALQTLNLLVGVSLVAYKGLSLSLTLDVMETDVEMAPVLPINFVKITNHIVSIPQSAASAA